MIIKTLAENLSSSPLLNSEHSLSLYIETNNKKILFDTGAGNLFLENACKMGVDIKDVDFAVISHGHYDHGGGLRTFLKENDNAPVYIHKKAFDNYYAKAPGQTPISIGIDCSLKWHERIVQTEGNYIINKEAKLFSGITEREFFSSSNDSLYMELGEFLVNDEFRHEQNLLIREADKMVLFAGCAHNGIVNIMKNVYTEEGAFPDYIFSGFHLFNKSTGKSEQPDLIEGIASFMVSTNAKFYTGHCTGIEAYNQLKKIMGDQIQYMATGSVFHLA